MTAEFVAFRKIPRLNREWILTEKIDGTNALVHVSDDMTVVRAGSRSRWITPEDDNHGFAKWVAQNHDELLSLGPGYHYGEWWGKGIGKRYSQFVDGKYFYLFNTERWSDDASRPKCCGVVPVLSRGMGIDTLARDAVNMLREKGSVIVPGCMRPEGVIAFHTAGNNLFKVLLENDAGHKGE